MGEDVCQVCQAQKFESVFEKYWALKNTHADLNIAIILTPSQQELPFVQHIVKQEQISFPLYIDKEQLWNNFPSQVLFINEDMNILYKGHINNNNKLNRKLLRLLSQYS